MESHHARQLPRGVTLHGPWQDRYEEILTPQALQFVAALHRSHNLQRERLLMDRHERQRLWDKGSLPGFLDETESIREDPHWRIAPLPAPLLDRRVEITGPVERKMMINALNSGAQVYMADFEDATSPTWHNMIQGQLNLLDHTQGRLRHKDPKTGKHYSVDEEPAVLVVRVRGLHLPEVHMRLDGEPVAAALFDFGLHFYHNVRGLMEKGHGPWYYLPKLEDRNEAAWWREVFLDAEQKFGLDKGTIKATCLIETFPAVFQMEEILFELKDHAAGLNAGRWDYLFSCIKTTRTHHDKTLPDRAALTMQVPFMRAYARLLVKTCHKRGASAIGGMSAFIPDRHDPVVTEQALEAVRADKTREAKDGCDGTWVAHPGLVPVAREVFQHILGGKRNQLERTREDLQVTPHELLDLSVPGAKITLGGLRDNLEVVLVYLRSWLNGRGAVAMNHLMEDAATAEISRAQVWQWVHHRSTLDNGTLVTKDLVETLLQALVAEQEAGTGRDPGLRDAARLLRDASLSDEMPDFITLPAYAVLTQEARE